MRRAFLCSLIVLLGALTFLAQSTTWKRYNNSGGNFTALFPTDPEDTVNKDGGGVRSHTVMAKESVAKDWSYIYTVIYTAMDDAQTVDDATYEVFKNAVFKALPKCEVGAERQADPAISGYVGHWYRLNCDMTPNKVTILGNLYWGKHYAYAVMVMFKSKEAEPQAAHKFLWSFGSLDLTR